MNKVYKVIWNEVSKTFVAVPEVVTGASRSYTSQTSFEQKRQQPQQAHFFIKSLVAALICIGFTFAIHAAPLSAQLTPPSPNQLPVGAQVSAGSATVSQTGSVLSIKQTTPKAALNWQSFNVGQDAEVDFVQPSSASVTLNRVLDTNPTQIFGKINANGQVFLENPNGVYFAPSASVDTGSFLATTSNISDADLLAGRYTFNRDGASGKIVNKGKITSTLGGYIALLAPEVRNAGVVVARGGTIVLAAGETYQLQFETNNTLTNILVSPSTIQAYIKNGNAVQAPGGLIILSAQAANAIQGGVIKNTGSITADVLVNDGGVIRLVASSTINNSGTISADASPTGSGKGGQISLIADLANPESQTQVGGVISAKGGGTGGDGGFIETSGSFVRVSESAQINTTAPKGTGGTWLLDPHDYTVAAASGDITGATLGAQLFTTSVTIRSSDGATGSSGNININDPIVWNGTNRLTLIADNDINFNSYINVPAAGGLSLIYGQSGTGSYNFNKTGVGYSAFNGFINLAGTGTGIFSTQFASNAAINYYVIRTPTSSAGGVTDSTGNYALGQNYNFTGSVGSSPITGTFSGIFEGLGHVIGNLNGTGAVGLFNNNTGTIQNVGVFVSINSTNSTIGALANNNSGLISNSYSTGSITGGSLLGGLVGLNSSSSSTSPSKIINSFSGVTISGTGGYLGGLVGENTTTGSGSSSTIANSYAYGSVTSTSGPQVGGLVGYNYAAGVNSVATITNSFARGDVVGPNTNSGSIYFFGGLVGMNRVNATGADASISNSYAIGRLLVAASGVGGLVGQNQILADNGIANFTNDYATGVVNTYPNSSNYSQSVGGLIGGNAANNPGSSATITNSYATGNVYGGSSTGGLIGGNVAQNGGNTSVSASHATGGIFSNFDSIGGLIGSNQTYGSGANFDNATTSTVTNSYATGAIQIAAGGVASSNQNTWGGLIGNNVGSGSTNRDNSVSGSYATGSVYATGGNLGGLIGANQTTGLASVTNSYALGAVSTISSAPSNTGGLIGLNQSNSFNGANGGRLDVSNSYATGIILGGFNVGGLIGNNNIASSFGSGNISNTYSSGNVSGTSTNVGGLVGKNFAGGANSSATISNSNVENPISGVSVDAGNTGGGLVGSNMATNTNASVSISNSYAKASVTGNANNFGGLVAINSASAAGSTANITQSYATGDVITSTGSYFGGLVGLLGASNTGHADIDQSFAWGKVQGAGYAGGLIGSIANSSMVTISNSFSTGNVVSVGGNHYGGLIGGVQSASLDIESTYAAGSISGSGTQMGALLGNLPSGATVTNNYWNITNNSSLSPTLGGVAGMTLVNPGISSLTTAQMQNLASFTGWDPALWGSVSYFNKQYPYLLNTTRLAIITLDPGNYNYGVTPTLNYTFADVASTPIDGSGATGTPVWTLSTGGSVVGNMTLSNATPAGNYSVSYAGGLYLSQGPGLGRYTVISTTPTSWAVQKIPLGLSVVGTYSGTNTIIPNTYTLTGLVNGETMALTQVTIADPNVTYANNYVTAIAGMSGTARLSNYQITPAYNATPGTTSTNTMTLNSLVLRVTEVPSVGGNYYNGSAYTGTYTLNTSQPSDLANITVTGMPTGITPGTYPSNLAVTLSGSALTNFGTPVITNANLVISPKIITITNTPLVTTYDQVTQFSQLANNTLYTATPLVGTDTLASITQTASKSGKATAGNYTVTPSVAVLGSGVPSNYQFSYVASTNTVNPLGITVSSIANATSAYGGAVTPGALSLTGVLAGDTVVGTASIAAPSYSSSNHLKVNSYAQTATTSSLSGADALNYSLTTYTTPTTTYTVTPIAVTGTIASGSSVYGAALAPGAVSLTGLITGDSVTSTATLASPTLNANGRVVVGSYNQTATSLSGTDALNYTFAGTTTTNLNYTVNPLTISVSSIASATSVYGAALTPGVVNLSGVLAGDTVLGSASVSGLLYSSSANVKAGSYPQRASLVLTGSDAGNYNLSAYTTPTSNYTVSPLTITVASIAAASSNYGATVSTGAVTLNGVLGADLVSSSAAVASPLYSTSNHLKVGNYNQTATTLTNTDAANYALTAYTTPTSNYTVNAIPLTGSIASANSTYGSAVTPGGVTLSGALPLDVVTSTASVVNPLLSTSGHLQVGHYNQTATALGGSDAVNYTFAGSTTTSLNYTVNTLTLSVASIANGTSVYGAVVMPGAVSLNGVVGADGVTSSAFIASPSFSTSNHLKAAVYNQTASTVLSGADAANYALTPYTTPVANYTVTPLTLTASIANSGSVYGSALLPGVVTLNGKLTGDLVQSTASIVNPVLSGALQLKAGSYNQSASTLSGVDATNYSLTPYTTTTLNYLVTPLALGASIADATSVYGGVVAPGAVSLIGLLGGDVVSSTASVALPLYSSSNHLRSGAYFQTASVLAGTDSGNYSLAAYTTALTNYTVTPLGINVVSIDPAHSNYGDTVSLGAVTLLGALAGDTVGGNATLFNPIYSTSNHLSAGNYKQTVATLNGADAANYSVIAFTTPTTNYTVTPLALTGAIAAGTSVYGGASTGGAVSLTGLLTGDVVSSVASLVSPLYSSSNHLKVGSYNQTASTLSGVDSINYTLTPITTATPNFTVTPLLLSASIAGVNVPYGTASAPGAVTLTGGLSGDALSSTASLVSALYSSSNHLNAGNYFQSASVLSGADAGNYSFSGVTTPNANYVVSPLSLTASVAAVSQTYGIPNAPGAVSLSGVLSGDAVQSVASITGSSLGTNLSSSGHLKVGNYTQMAGNLTGSDALNYTLANGSASYANYTVKALSITVDSIAPISSIYASSSPLGAVSLTGVLAQDQVMSSASLLNALYSSSKNLVAGAYNQTASQLSGMDAGNYSLVSYTTPQPNYIVKPLSLSASIASSSSVYGQALSPGVVALSGVKEGDQVSSLSSLANPNYSTGLYVAAGNYAQSVTALSGVDANNYSLLPFTTPTPNYSVSPRVISASVSPVSITYGESASTGLVALTGVLTNDVVQGTSSLQNPTFSSTQHLNAGAYSQNVALKGLDAQNYSLAQAQTQEANYTVAPLALVGSIAASSSVSGSPLSPGLVALTNVIPGDQVGSAKVEVTIPGQLKGSLAANQVGTFVGSQSIASLSGVDAKNYSVANVKGDYTVKAGFTPASVYPQESLTVARVLSPLSKALDMAFTVASRDPDEEFEYGVKDDPLAARQFKSLLSSTSPLPDQGTLEANAANSLSKSGTPLTGNALPNFSQNSGDQSLQVPSLPPGSLASINSRIDVPQTRYFVPAKEGAPRPQSRDFFPSAQANELNSDKANSSLSLQNKSATQSSEPSLWTGLERSALDGLGQAVEGFAHAVPVVGEAISSVVEAYPMVGDAITGLALMVPVAAEVVATLGNSLTLVSASNLMPVVQIGGSTPSPAPSRSPSRAPTSPAPATNSGAATNSRGNRPSARFALEG